MTVSKHRALWRPEEDPVTIATSKLQWQVTLFLAASVALAPVVAQAAETAQPTKVGYDDTPVHPDGKWRVHDGKRPLPPLVAPAASIGKPPSDAIVLIGPGSDTSAWVMKEGGAPMTWKMKGGVLESGKGYARTKEEWSDFQLHLEWASPSRVEGTGQGRGNSGLFLLDQFEIQILDSHGNVTYPDGQAASMYGQFPPMVNAALKPGAWQTYDVMFSAPRWKDGKLERPAIVTVVHNGVVVHHAQAFWGPTSHKKIGEYKPGLTKGPIALQDHGNPVRFRNMWLRPLRGYDQP